MNKIFILFLFYSCASSNLKLSIIPTHFYETNKVTIDKAVVLVQEYCQPQKTVKLSLKFDYLPQELINLNPNQIGQTSFYSDVTWIETNIFKFAYLNDQDRFLYLLHEVGHALGLEHVEEDNQVMSGIHNQNANINEFKSILNQHCSVIHDVPRHPNFSMSKN